MSNKVYGFLSILVLAFFFMFFSSTVYASNIKGDGTEESPYLIENAADLISFRDSVNNGNNYLNKYILQTTDIDLSGEEWIPIGIYEDGGSNYFYGTYDGGGHAVTNLQIHDKGNNGFFGRLGGTVLNLGIESGSIEGECCGGIASHSIGNTAAIINCYNKADVIASLRAGGIADNFAGNIIGCWSSGIISAPVAGGIVSYTANDIDYCLTSEKTIAPLDTMSGKIDNSFASTDFSINNLQTVVDELYKNLPYVGTKAGFSVFKLNSCVVKDSNICYSDEEYIFISPLFGSGSTDEPYLITNLEDLLKFRDDVNNGNTYVGKYVVQLENIDLTGETWIPIGNTETGNYFYGIYDGTGHTILSLNTIEVGSNGFFGRLGGIVQNLGIESGTINGLCCGAIASHSASSTAKIINCYNKAKVIGELRAGGIADNFMGSIIGCWSDCTLEGKVTGGIAAFDVGSVDMCYTSAEVIVPKETLTGTISDSESGIDFSKENSQRVCDDIYRNIPSVADCTNLSLSQIYPYQIKNGNLVFSNSAYRFSLRIWAQDNRGIVAAVLILFAVFAILALKVGPKSFYSDDRPWNKRFLLILGPSFLLFYMFLIHSPIEFFLINNSEFNFIFGDFAWSYIAMATVLSLVMAGLFSLVKGKACDAVACAIFGLDLSMYIQLNFMNTSLGLLDGNEKNWSAYGIWNYENLFIWIVLIALPFGLFIVLKKQRSKIISSLCMALVVMQVTALVTLIIQSPESAFVRDNSSSYYLSGADQYKVSSDKNIIILVIDTFSNSYVDRFFDEYPETADVIKDFTYYDNADCHFEGSVYSINYIASGIDFDPTITINDWCKQAWNNDRNNAFYKRLSENNFKFNIYTNQLDYLTYSAKKNAVGKIANLGQMDVEYEINNSVMLGLFANASAFRFAPMLLKPYLVFSAEKYRLACNIVNKDKNALAPIKTNGYYYNDEFYQHLLSTRLSTDSTSNYYILQHLYGVHDPYITDESCKPAEDATLYEAARGCWLYVEEYINQLKELGVYDSSTIIITADHGTHHSYQEAQPIFFVKSPNESHEKYVTSSAPVSFVDIMPTVAYLAGAQYEDLGTTIYEHAENEQRERTLFIRMYDEELPESPKYNSPSNSLLNCFYKYVYTGNQNDLTALGDKGPTEKVPWTEAFY